MKTRLFVLTDITSLQSGVREPDDGQSLVRLLMYADKFDFEGFGASSNLGHGQQCRPELISEALEAYERDFPKLKVHGDFPAPELLKSKVTGGIGTALPDLPLEASFGEGKDSDTSRLLVKAIERDDSRPLWVVVWGGTADLAQALWVLHMTKSEEQLRNLLKRVRVHAIADQDSTAAWIKAEFPDLLYITRKVAFRGMYRGGDTTLNDSEWVEQNIKPFGALGALYPNYSGGDIWSNRLGKVRGVKEGDTVSYLNLLGDDPFDGWGGRVVEVLSNRYEDEPISEDISNGLDPRIASVYRHRAAFQNDFAARLKWLK